MTSYGGYNRTSYGAQGGGDDGGGFLGGSQQGSQGGGGAGKSFSDESLRPVTIKQLVDCEELYPNADLTIDGIPVTQVTLVGQVRTVSPQATNITYRLDDGTAVMDVKKWVDAEKPDDADPKFAQDQYVRVWGRLKSFNGKKHVSAHCIRAIDDYNEINYHLLEATYVHLLLTKPQGGGGASGAGGASGEDGMFVDGYGAANAGANGGVAARVGNCSRNAQTMYNFLHGSPGGNEGVHLNVIVSSASLSIRDVMAAADELLAGGFIYTTIDDETWAILDY